MRAWLITVLTLGCLAGAIACSHAEPTRPAAVETVVVEPTVVPTIDDHDAGQELTEDELLRLNEHVCPLDGRVAYVTGKDGNIEVYVRNADGTGEINISNQMTNDGGPIWSPDCRSIAYSSDRNWFPENTWEIFVAASDGSGEYLLLPAAADRCCNDYAKAWSPDGAWIAFNGRLGHDLYLVHPDGTDLRWIAFGSRPEWAPDAQSLTYRHPIGNWPTDLYRVNIDGSDRVLLAQGEAPPRDCFQDVVSPDGKLRACMTTRDGWNQEIYVIDIATGVEINVTNDLSGADTDPDWSPDSRQLAFASDRHGVFEIFVVNADGSGLRQVTKARCGRPCGGDQVPRWSSDGQLLTFIYAPQGVDIPCEVKSDGSSLKCTPPTPVPTECIPAEVTVDGRIVRCR